MQHEQPLSDFGANGYLPRKLPVACVVRRNSVMLPLSVTTRLPSVMVGDFPSGWPAARGPDLCLEIWRGQGARLTVTSLCGRLSASIRKAMRMAQEAFRK